MELFKNLRLKIGKYLLIKKTAGIKRKIYYSNIEHVKNIGIVWDASRTADFAALSRFYQKMHEKNIEVKILGFFPGKELPDQYTALRFLTCIRKPEINLFYFPVSPETNLFINNRFDVLIDINFNNLFPLQYVSSMSVAGFKVGLYESESTVNMFELMIEMKKPVDVDNFLNQVVHYLEMIKSGADKPVFK